MSFLSVLQAIGHGITTATNAAAPFIPAASTIPVAGPIIGTVFGSISAVEQLITTPGSGATKKAVAMQIIQAAHPNADPVKLNNAIDNIVTALNSIDTAMNNLK